MFVQGTSWASEPLSLSRRGRWVESNVYQFASLKLNEINRDGGPKDLSRFKLSRARMSINLQNLRIIDSVVINKRAAQNPQDSGVPIHSKFPNVIQKMHELQEDPSSRLVSTVVD